ncbi:MAG TPA: FimV/HubP family polar landmark protein [Gammaproteobacteria bacterium]|jgi:FimV-like protein|nr:FimV/HubP family polar landmark protein [Gammaproteobacteria bacterium]
MITLIIKSYLAILLSVGIGALVVFILGIYLIFNQWGRRNKAINTKLSEIVIEQNQAQPSIKVNKKKIKKENTKENAYVLEDELLSAISGEDKVATQLDLARAYIETGKQQLAKKILEIVVKQGNAMQQSEAQELLDLC